MTMLDGRAALSQFDGVLSGARRALSEAIEAEKQADHELASIRRDQSAAYLALADFQLDNAVSEARLAALRQLDGEVAEQLAAQEAYIERALGELEDKAAEIEALEQARAAEAAKLDDAVERYEAVVAEVEAALEASDAYQSLVEAAAEAEAVTERARQKQAVAQDDRLEKGARYEADALFMYLWKRGFRTPDYKAPPLIRYLDAWVARVCKYDRAYRNYDRLTALPKRIAEHVIRMEEADAKARDALEAAETHALSNAGANALQSAVEAARTQLATLDAEIEAAEEVHLKLAEIHAQAEAGDRGPAYEARIRLSEALKQASFPDLRLLVTQTVTAEDDRLVDQLVTLRKNEMALDMRRDEISEAPARRRGRLEALERFRRLFKREQLDSPYAGFTASAIDAALDALISDRMRPDDVVRTLKRKVRRRQPRAHPGFGGSTRRRTSGLPDIAKDIGWEILKEVSRSSRRGGSPFDFPSGGFPTSRRSGRKVSLPNRRSKIGGRRRGGFKTGGGF